MRGVPLGNVPFMFMYLGHSRVEVAVDSVAKSVANVAISCWSRRMMSSPRSLRLLVMTWSSTALAL